MTFLSLEQSQSSSVPMELYEFSYQNNTLRYTSGADDVVISGTTYTAMPLSRTNIMDSGEIGKNNMQITAPDQFPVSLLFAAGPPDDIVTLVVKRYQAALTTDIDIIWLGRVMTVGWPPQISQLNCESVFTALRQSGLHRVYTVNCPFSLYGAECKANILTFEQTLSIDIQIGNTLNAPGFALLPDGWFAGGRLIWEVAPGNLVKRGIKNHVGNQIEITFAMPNFPNGQSVTVAPGCDHSYPTCGSKFSNQINYGGFPYMVQKNPWGGSSVF